MRLGRDGILLKMFFCDKSWRLKAGGRAKRGEWKVDERERDECKSRDCRGLRGERIFISAREFVRVCLRESSGSGNLQTYKTL